MDKIMEININDKDDIFDKYNDKNISKEFIEYIINKTKQIELNKNIKFICIKKCDIEKNIVELIRKELEEEYKISLKERNKNNIKQIIFLLMGIIFIILSTNIEDKSIWKEISLITGWVHIWEMIELEMFSDMDGRIKRKTIKRILNSEMIETEKNVVVM